MDIINYFCRHFSVRLWIFIIALVGLTSCSQYQKVLKKGTPQEKLDAARKYYEKEDYVRAQPLLEELMGLYFGKPEREEIYFLYAYCHYGLQEFLIAGYHFNNFAKTYPFSKHKEETSFRAAMCDYYRSLTYELDQTNTKRAIGSLQTFINQYPNSTFVAECNTRIDELRARLLEKEYRKAKLYYQLSEYRAAIVACTNALEDYPDMINRDELFFIIADASYIYAANSVETQQLDRYKKAQTAIDNYLKNFDSTNQYHAAVTKLKTKTEAALATLELSTSEQ